MKKNKRVLILYAPLGSGHGAAAAAIEEAFLLSHPEVEIKNINVLDFYPQTLKHGIPLIFDLMTFRCPLLYKWTYYFYNNKSNIKFLNFASSISFKKISFIKFIEDFNPDFILATNPLPMQLISQADKKIADILSANVCTDFGFHELWLNLDVNYFFVSNDSVKESLVKYVSEGAIGVTGIPVSLKLKRQTDKERIIKELDFNPKEPIILIVGGRLSYRRLIELLKGISGRSKTAQFIIAAGRDNKLKEKIIKSEYIQKNSSFIKHFGFINNLEEYMSVADIIITKAGGITVSECLVKKLPMVINDIIPGQEQDNVEYVVKNRVGFKANNAVDLVEIIACLLERPGELQAIKDKCEKLAKPDAAEKIADFVVSKITT